MVEVSLCMGSSCYARGNREILEILEVYLQDNNLAHRVSLEGAHCLGDCGQGPVIRMDDQVYTGLHPSCITDILRYHLEKKP